MIRSGQDHFKTSQVMSGHVKSVQYKVMSGQVRLVQFT